MTYSLFIDDSSFLGGGFGFKDYDISAEGLMDLRSAGGDPVRAVRQEDIIALRGEEVDPNQFTMELPIVDDESDLTMSAFVASESTPSTRPALRPNPNRMSM